MYVTSIVTQTKSLGQVRTAETYASAERSFMRFRGGVDCSLAELTAPLILQYEAYLRGTGLCPNSIAFYLKRLQALYNKAVNEGLHPTIPLPPGPYGQGEDGETRCQ